MVSHTTPFHATFIPASPYIDFCSILYISPILGFSGSKSAVVTVPLYMTGVFIFDSISEIWRFKIAYTFFAVNAICASPLQFVPCIGRFVIFV